MSRLVEEGVRPGELGVTASRSEAYQSVTGQAVLGTSAGQRELLGLAQGLKRVAAALSRLSRR